MFRIAKRFNYMEVKMSNEVKPRYDHKGSEFGAIHRQLPIKCGMFDIDRMSATAVINLELKHQDVGFLEYRTDFDNSNITWKALFEIKYKDSQFVQKAIECNIGTATWAQMKMCERLGCRYFIVVANYGKQPFTFYEILDSQKYRLTGELDYIDRYTDGKENIIYFWHDVLKL